MSICCKWVGLDFIVLGIFELNFMFSVNFLFLVFFCNDDLMLWMILRILVGRCLIDILLVLIFEIFRILLINFSKWCLFWCIVFKVLFVMEDVERLLCLLSILVKFKMVVIGVWILWFMLYRKCVLVLFVVCVLSVDVFNLVVCWVMVVFNFLLVVWIICVCLIREWNW